MGELYDPIKAKAISQGFNRSTGSSGIQEAATNLAGAQKTTAIDRRLALAKKETSDTD